MEWIVLISIYLFIRIVIVPAINRFNVKQTELSKKIIEAIEDDRKETELLQSGKMPTDEHIELYYKMYVKKFELDHEDEWSTQIPEPMSFSEFEKRAKMCLDTVGGYPFIIGSTMDMFMHGPDGNAMMRCRDYRGMIEND